MVLVDSPEISRASGYSGYQLRRLVFRVRDCYPLWSAFPERFHYTPRSILPVPQPRSERIPTGLGCFHFAHRYYGNRDFFLFLRVLRCFSSPGSPPYTYVFSAGYCASPRSGFPHSDIFGSSPVSGYPKLFAACHVLHRLLAPGHPP